MRRQDKHAEGSFFDEYAQKGEYDVLTPEAYRRILRRLDGIRACREGRQVDAGCGTGAFTRYMVGEKWSTIALDLSHDCLRTVHSSIRGVHAVQGDIESLPFADDSIDLLVYSGVLHHLPDLTRASREAFRVLRPGGGGFAYDPHERHPLMWFFRSHRSPFSYTEGRTTNERNLTKGEVRQVFNRAGFIEVRVESASGMVFRHVHGQARIALAAYHLIETFLAGTRLDRAVGSFLLTSFTKPRCVM
jgi:ubiquinone/menaquinone biosynthesis C-methylase UbiE